MPRPEELWRRLVAILLGRTPDMRTSRRLPHPIGPDAPGVTEERGRGTSRRAA